MDLMPWKEWQRTLPRKRMGAGVIVWDGQGRLLLLKPNYKDHWQIPGGVVDGGESPRQAAQRELKEETGLDISINQLLAVNYNQAKGEDEENLQWIFYGGVLSDTQIKNIRVDKKEIDDFVLAEPGEIDKLTKRDISSRIPWYKEAMKTGRAYYLEDWENVNG